MSRTIIAAGNWKMNKTAAEAVEFVKGLAPLVAGANAEVVVGVPFVCIPDVKKAVAGTNIKVAAQNMHWEEKGAFTGEISGQMLNALDVDYVIIGHSERRQYFNETDETVNKKVHACFANGMKPIVCVGESLTQREQGVMPELVRYQTKIALLDLTVEQVKETVIAYEPIWAIGTGKVATSEQAQEVCSIIRGCVAEVFGGDAAQAVRIQYGGSVTGATAAELFGMKDIDGGLVGGASLKLDEFEKIAKHDK
ncbi:MAG: triose-phosphate isomerase [Bacillota bacterium]